MTNLSLLPANWVDSIKSGIVRIYKQHALHYSTANSVVSSIPFIECAGFFPNQACNIAASLVEIRGPTDEPLHFHSSHLVGLIVAGEAFCRYLLPPERAERREIVAPGDVVVLPRGAMHIFECEPDNAMSYVALEFSDKEIDYQKHFD